MAREPRTEALRPARYWYWVGGALIALGVAGAIAWLVVGLVGLVRQVDDFQRVSVPGSGTVTFDDTGGYTLYDESPGADQEGGSSVLFTASLESPSGRPVALSAYDGSLNYAFGGHSGRAVATFDIDEPGNYRLSTETIGAGTGTVAVGRGIAGRLVATVLGTLLTGAVGLTAGGTAMLVTGIRRGRAKRWAAAGGPPPPSGVPTDVPGPVQSAPPAG